MMLLLAFLLVFFPRPEDPAPEDSDPYRQHIFFAVLEGLYRDGVQNEVVDRILVLDDKTKFPANFVWNCPACMPAYEAFRVYRARVPFMDKTGADTFGPGLSPETTARIMTGHQDDTQRTLEALIAGWMGQRMDALRLTEAERADWRTEMEMRRKKGMSMLQDYREGLGGSYASMKTCPICEGANAPWQRR